MTQRMADIEASIVALDDEDLLDLADIFKAKLPTLLAKAPLPNVSEWNRYTWPGYDTRPIPGREPETSYGFIPSSLFRRVRDAMVAIGIGRPVDRDG